MIDMHDSSTMADFCKDQLAQDIQYAMDESGMNQTTFSVAIGTSRQYVSAMLRPSYNPTIKKLAEIASALKKKLVIRLVGETVALIPVPVEKIPQVRDFVYYNQPLEKNDTRQFYYNNYGGLILGLQRPIIKQRPLEESTLNNLTLTSSDASQSLTLTREEIPVNVRPDEGIARDWIGPASFFNYQIAAIPKL